MPALERARQIEAPQWIYNHVVLAMICGQLGQQAQAEASVRRILDMDPTFGRNVWYEMGLRNFSEDVVE